MKVIELLTKIANGEESDTITEFEFNKSIWNFFKLQDSEYCIDEWLLNQEIVITKHKEIIEEDKKIEKITLLGEEIPEKIKYELKINTYLHCHYVPECLNDEVEIIEEEINKDIKWYFIEEQENEKTKIAQINMNFKILREKLTEIIDKLNEMEKE